MKGLRKKVFSGKLIRVYRSYLDLPDGRRSYFEQVEHPGAAIAVPFIGQKLIFIRQYRAVVGKYLWELPAGKLSCGEAPSACARREVAEETGYIVSSVKRAGMMYTSPGFSDEKIFVYTAQCSKKGKTARDWDEVISVKLSTKTEARRMVRSGKITDAKTVVALAFAGII